MNEPRNGGKQVPTFTGPEEIDNLPAVVVYSDAATNDAAIREIDQWARTHGFIRSREYHLNTVLREGRLLRYSACLRPREGADAAAEMDLKRIQQRRDEMALTKDSAELLRGEA